MSIAENLRDVRARMVAACEAAGRDPGSVTLIAVSKTRPLADVLEAADAGQLDFGENYAQELRDKVDECHAAGRAPGARWHFIGALQSNKARHVAPRADWVHDVDRLELAVELGRRVGATHAGPRRLNVLLGVNIGEEPQKSGVLPADALDLAARIHGVDAPGVVGVQLRGLMCIPPADADPRPHFERLRALQQEGLARGLPLHELSMGMSHDYAEAIACGATFVRVGTAIFGPRTYPATPVSR